MHSIAILLPLTSRGSPSISSLWFRLENLCDSIRRRGANFDAVVFVGIDKNDEIFDEEISRKKLSDSLQKKANCSKVNFRLFDTKPGNICYIWRSLARDALLSDASLFLLLGDDVVIDTQDWAEIVWQKFRDISNRTKAPFGFGAVALKDQSFRGFPTFPVIHRLHLDIFHGDIFPDAFVNQDADPFLFELYRKWKCSEFVDVYLTNSIGGSEEHPARYKKHHVDWKGDVLNAARNELRRWLADRGKRVQEVLLLDTITPSFRCNEEYLRRIVELKVPNDVSTLNIIVIDNPADPHATIIKERFEKLYEDRVRIRILDSNQGASAARNRGLDESCADFVVFIDDDVIPHAELLFQYAAAIQTSPSAGGFVGCTTFPSPCPTARALGVKLSGCTYFWDAAAKMSQMPWGVTANLCTKRGSERFDLRFPKTGGGEDIDFCVKVLQNHGQLQSAPLAKATHPWWDNGRPALNRFFGWASGDGHLQYIYQHLSYRNYPNVVEATILSFPLLFALSLSNWLMMVFAFWFADAIGDFGTHYLYEQTDNDKISYSRSFYFAAVIWSFLTKNALELGHFYRNFATSGVFGFCKRFDWFCGQYPRAITEEKQKALKRFIAFVAIAASFVKIQ